LSWNVVAAAVVVEWRKSPSELRKDGT